MAEILDIPAATVVNRPQIEDALSGFELHGDIGDKSLTRAPMRRFAGRAWDQSMIHATSLDDRWWHGSVPIEDDVRLATREHYLRWLQSQQSATRLAMVPIVKVAKPVGDERLAAAIVTGGDDIARLVSDLIEARGSAAIDLLRESIGRLTHAFEQLARGLSDEELREATTDHSKEDFRALLQRLADDYGLSWHTIATMLGVTPTAVRKWRRGGSITAENREQVSALAAFFDQLDGLDIADLGSWIEMRVHEDATLTPAEIYRSGPDGRWLLLERARGRIDAVTMLDRFDPTWRVSYARDPNFRVVQGLDGERAIVPR